MSQRAQHALFSMLVHDEVAQQLSCKTLTRQQQRFKADSAFVACTKTSGGSPHMSGYTVGATPTYDTFSDLS